MASGDNWTKEETQKAIISNANKVLKKAKEQEEEKLKTGEFKYIKSNTIPPTWKLVKKEDS